MLGAALVRSREPQVVGMGVGFHLDHVGTQIGEQAGHEGARPDPAEIQHAQVSKAHGLTRPRRW
jgi:hypothetical protein